MGRMVRPEDAREIFGQIMLDLPAQSAADGHNQSLPVGVAPRLERLRRMGTGRWSLFGQVRLS